MAYSYGQLPDLLNKKPETKLFIITGNDDYLIIDCIKKIMSSHSEHDILKFDFAKLDYDALGEAFLSYPLLSKRLIIIENFNMGKQDPDISGFLKDIPDFLTVVLSNFIDGKFILSGQYIKLSESVKCSEIISAQKLYGRQLINYITETASELGASVTGEAAAALVDLVGNELYTLNQEIQKLAAFSEYSTIEKKHVMRITVKATENYVYDMVSALEKQNIRNALSILVDMLDNRTDPSMIAAVLNTVYINLYRAKLIISSGTDRNEIYTLFNYKKDDKKVSIALSQANRYSKTQLRDILELLYQLDIDLKSSSASKSLLLEQAVVEIASSRK